VHREPAVQSVVEVTLGIIDECRLVESIMKSLTADNRVLTRNMVITEILEKTGSGDCTYTVKITIYGDNDTEVLKRARSTLNDILLALKADLSVLSALKT
jgi:hypothetical protein